MGIDIHGWVEAYEPYNGEWDGIIRIPYLVGRTYKMFALLFGIKNDWSYVPIAPSRGIPTDISTEVVLERREIRDRRYDDIGPSWIAWSEITQIDWNAEAGVAGVRQEALVPSWQVLFDLMDVLGKRYGERGVRLVVWFRDDRSEG